MDFIILYLPMKGKGIEAKTALLNCEQRVSMLDLPCKQQVEANQLTAQKSLFTNDHREHILKQQQQRLLLLRHAASECPHSNGACPSTPNCWRMKQLWKHMKICKDQGCKIAFCVSSRYVLMHYSKCKEQSCQVCGPVREVMKNNYKQSKNYMNHDANSCANYNVSSCSTPRLQHSSTDSNRAYDTSKSLKL
jgi:E1A/CREB-binding protein